MMVLGPPRSDKGKQHVLYDEDDEIEDDDEISAFHTRCVRITQWIFEAIASGHTTQFKTKEANTIMPKVETIGIAKVIEKVKPLDARNKKSMKIHKVETKGGVMEKPFDTSARSARGCLGKG
ncbi:hypothetical protein E3N88_27960 [Mikania micrantha]|uniref:Uncharacterized protein n=1 Tax=Mikania micrantha TaxID=192012 RepID=A0A5N6MY55_9ASTR|nr:hypothetical protein E3N88_27960 [Mikania micrantha]